MAHKAQLQPDTAIDPELEKRVDTIMAPGNTDISVKTVDEDLGAVIAVRTRPSETAEPQPAAIYSEPVSAPAVPAALLQQIKSNDLRQEKVAVTKKTAKMIAVVEDDVVAVPIVVAVDEAPAESMPEPLAVLAADSEPEVVKLADAKPAIDKLYPTVFPKRTNADPIPISLDAPTRLDDTVTDAAIAAITASDSDELLAAEDAKSAAAEPIKIKKSSWLSRIFKRKLLWLVLLVLLVAAGAIPTVRNTVLGAVIKRSVSLTVVDSVTSKPVSAATVTVDGSSATTDAKGRVTMAVPFGPHTLGISKQYYKAGQVGIAIEFSQPPAVTSKIIATGRQVPITVINSITGKPVAGVELSVLKTSSKTDSQGRAIIVLPTVGISTGGKATASGYNSAAVIIQITSDTVAANTFSITPAGKIYTLSNESGTLDVVKKNLDGSDKQVVLKGTGKEDIATTTLLVSQDWRYAVLRSQRDTPQPALYLIDTYTDKVTTFDSGDTAFTTIGWIGHNFVYDAVKNIVPASQSGHEIVRSYDADRLQLNQIDQGMVDGDAANYAYQGFYNFFIIGDQLIYNTQWYVSGVKDVKDKTVAIRTTSSNGQNKKDLLQIPASGVGYIQAARAGVKTINFASYNYDNGKTAYYQFDGTVAASSTSVTAASFNKSFPRYMSAPSGKTVLWNELRDGRSAVFLTAVATASAATAPTAAYAGFTAYGWYDDTYILLAKSPSELYIAPADGSKAPLKIGNYYSAGQAAGNGYGNIN